MSDYPRDAPLVVEAPEALVRRVVREELQARTPPPSPYMPVVEAAEDLRCPRRRVDDLLSAGHLERIKDGSRTLVRRRDVEKWLGERRARAVTLRSRPNEKRPSGARTPPARHQEK